MRDPSITEPSLTRYESTATAAHLLAEHSLGIDADQSIGLETIARLAVAVESYRLVYDNPFDAIPLVQALGPPQTADTQLTRIEHPEASEPGVVTAAPGLTTWCFADDSSLVGSAQHGCLSLEASQWPLWSVLLDGCPKADIVDAASTTGTTEQLGAWMQEMSERGFVTGWNDHPSNDSNAVV
jgi:hypothetical protein